MVQKKNATTAVPIKLEAAKAKKCTALTDGGNGPRCTRNATIGSLCAQHNAVASKPAPVVAPCTATKKCDKQPCTHPATRGNVCGYHAPRGGSAKKAPAPAKKSAPALGVDSETYANKKVRGLDSMTVPELKALCKGLGITGYSTLPKAELLEMVRAAPGGSMKWYYLTHADTDTEMGLVLNASVLTTMATHYNITGRSSMKKEDLRNEVASEMSLATLADLRSLATKLGVCNNISEIAKLRTALAEKMFR